MRHYVLIGLFKQGGPVFDRAGQMSDVDVIERVLRPRPLGLGIVDLELHVWRDPGGLDGA